MKANLKCQLFAVPVLACAVGAASASPVSLDDFAMDRVTAGAMPTFGQIVSIVAAIPVTIGTGNPANTSMLDRALWDKLIAQSLSVPVTFRLLNTGELVASQQLPTGEHILIIQPLAPADATTLAQARPGDVVSTATLGPGESLRFQQTSYGGTNYIVVRSTGSSAITTLQKSGL